MNPRQKLALEIYSILATENVYSLEKAVDTSLDAADIFFDEAFKNCKHQETDYDCDGKLKCDICGAEVREKNEVAP